MIVFEVFGVPIPKGSTKAFMRPGMRYPVVTADNAKTKPWAQQVTATALPLRQDPLWEGPVSIRVLFQMPKPKGLPKRRFSFHLRKPDEDKLLRNVKDALKGIFYYDDSQVVRAYIQKQYAEIPSMIVQIQELGVDDAYKFMERHLPIR